MPLIDELALNHFYQDDEALLIDMTKLFVEHLPAIVKRIRVAIANRDSNELHEAAHQFKSDLGYFFSTDLRTIACQLETQGRNQKLDGCDALAEELFRGLAGLLSELSSRTHMHLEVDSLGDSDHKKETVR